MINKARTLKNVPYCHICNRQIGDVLPTSESRIIKHRTQDKDSNLRDVILNKPENISKEFRVNNVNIQMISKNLYEQLFKSPTPEINPSVIKR